MSIIAIPAAKFFRLFDYLETIGLDVVAVCDKAGLSCVEIKKLADDKRLSAADYSNLYKQVVLEMQALGSPIPWAAGIGSDFFDVMCHYVIGASTLRGALKRAEKVGRLVFPLSCHRVHLVEDEEYAYLHYSIDTSKVDEVLVPKGWDRADTFETVSKSSGLLAWHALCGWLIGRAIEAQSICVDAPPISDAYTAGVHRVTGCTMDFMQKGNVLTFSKDFLDYRIVHTLDSLQGFLTNTVYQLIAIERKPATTSAAIKSLVGIDFTEGLPAFSEIANSLHMSESSLRRRLLAEDSSYQMLKDEIRCAAAIEHLKSSSIKVNDLSDLLGYTESSSFVRSFKNWMGVTPKAYREQMKRLASK